MPCLTPALATVKTTRGEAAVSGKAEAPALPGHLEQPRFRGNVMAHRMGLERGQRVGKVCQGSTQMKRVGGKDTALSCAGEGWKSLAGKERK